MLNSKFTIESVIEAIGIDLPDHILAACREVDRQFVDIDRMIDQLAANIPTITPDAYEAAMHEITLQSIELDKKKTFA